jgi:hypothetical protein
MVLGSFYIHVSGPGALIILALYFVPSIVALARGVPNVGSVVVIDVFLGWTFIGWVVALAMACRTVPPR